MDDKIMLNEVIKIDEVEHKCYRVAIRTASDSLLKESNIPVNWEFDLYINKSDYVYTDEQGNLCFTELYKSIEKSNTIAFKNLELSNNQLNSGREHKRHKDIYILSGITNFISAWIPQC